MSKAKHPAGPVLQAYHDDELDPVTAAELASHCERCETCRAELAELQRLSGILASTPAPKLARAVWPRVQPGERHGSRFRPAYAIAACAAGILLGVLLGPVRFGEKQAGNELAWMETVTLWDSAASSSLLGVYQSGQD